MAFFEQLGKRLSDAGQGVARQTKNFADVTRLNGAISDKERRITQLYQSIGQTYYQRHQDDAAPEFQAETEEIRRLLAEILRDQEEIKQIRGIVKCPECGADVPFQAAFCNSCGAKMTPGTPLQRAAEGKRTCPTCGAVSGEGNLFCTNCGTRLEENRDQEG